MAYYGQQPQVDPAVLAWFQAVDVDRSGRISGLELQQALTNNDWSRFSLDTCYYMIALFDKDYSRTIDLYEFNSLWGFINQWRNVFNGYDQDRSGTISYNELQTAFRGMGYNVSQQFMTVAMLKYDHNKTGHLTFEGFIRCCLLLQLLTGNFKQKDTTQSGVGQFGYDDFMCIAINALKP